MPHDCNNLEIKPGDVVTMRFQVREVFPDATACNVNLVAIPPSPDMEDNPEVYHPMLTATASMVMKED